MKTKILSLMLAVLMTLSSLPFAGLTAFAEANNNEITEEYLQYMLDLLPEEIDLDYLPEEKDEAQEYVETLIKNIWRENEIDITEIDFEIWVSDNSPFCDVTVYIDADNDYNVDMLLVKNISLKWKYPDNFNFADEQAVEKFIQKLEPIYFAFDKFDADKSSEVTNYYNQIAAEYSIDLVYRGYDGGADNALVAGYNFAYEVFKNGTSYGLLLIGVPYLQVVTVPNSIPEKEIKSYLSEEIQKIAFWNINITDIEKGAKIDNGYYSGSGEWIDAYYISYNSPYKHIYNTNVIEVPDGYTVYYTDGESYVIVRREADTDAPATDDAIIAYGTDETYVIGSGKGASIHCSYPLDEFISVYINGELVDEANYTLREGSTILTFKSEYLDTLPSGVYDVTLNFVSGSVSTNLTVMAKPISEDKDVSEKSPSTGAAGKGLLALAAIALASGMIMFVKKKEWDF